MSRILFSAMLFFTTTLVHSAPATQGYYRFPTLRGNTIVFTSQGDLWKVSTEGGAAQALTMHPGMEAYAAISPEGKRIAFSASYEGPTEVYVMPIEGGLPTRLTFDGSRATVVGWTPQGKVLYSTTSHSTLPEDQLCAVDPDTRAQTLLPLAQASDGCYDAKGETLYFTRLPFQGSHTKRYKGGTAQNIWKLTSGAREATPLTANFTGTSKTPMWWNGRIYFVSDRDGTMNLWSMDTNGGSLKQLTHHDGWDIQFPALDNGRIVYQLGADLHLYTIATGKDRVVEITAGSDMDQTREKWITRPMDYLTDVSPAPDGERVALTARGQVFVAPLKQGRLVEVTRRPGVRYRNAFFTPDGKSLIALSDETGETEWWRLPANGVGTPERLSADAKVLRTGRELSPDGKKLAFGDKNQDLWIFDIEKKSSTRIATCMDGEFSDIHWSPDSQWLAYVRPTASFDRIMLYSLKSGQATTITTDRADSDSPAWSPDGKWLYFLSNRTFQTLVPSPWGSREPEPYFDRQTKIYQLALTKGLRSGFQAPDELQPARTETPAKPKEGQIPVVSIDLDSLEQRLWEVPAPAGNYENLSVSDNRLFWISHDTSREHKASLMGLTIENTDIAAKMLVDNLQGYGLSHDKKHVLVQKSGELFVFDSTASAPAPLDKKIDLSGWTFSIDPREEWHQMLVEAWRLERDFFYDKNLHHVGWDTMLQKYLPLCDRVRDRDELSDLVGQMVGELSALHTFVVGGDNRSGPDHVQPASLGATLSRDTAHGGYKIDHIYAGDPDYPNTLAPLVRPDVHAREGDVILKINGVDTLSVADPNLLLRNQAGRQTLLTLRDGSTAQVRDAIVAPINQGQFSDLRYSEWEVSRRHRVEEQSKNAIGYVHLRDMGAGSIEQWEREFYPVFDRQGLIVDVRNNNGGNIDSWVLEKLLRRAWFYWQPRVGNPTWNMPWAFRGHIVVLCNENTASDGEAFAEGFRRLGLGKVIGTRTWGGEIWLSFDNTLVDNGIASAAETGVYGPEGKWLIEGHGVDPDIVVDNLPCASFRGGDAQLDAAITYLQKEIHDHPVPVTPTPAYPDKRYVNRPPRRTLIPVPSP